MVKKIIHMADIHIRTYRMHGDYEAAFEELYAKCRELTEGYEHNEVRIAIVGDLLHQKITISNELLMMTSKFLTTLAQIAPVILVAGNHDLLENNKERVDSITPIVTLINSLDIAYYKGRECYPDDNIVWCNYSIFEHNERPDIEGFKSSIVDTTNEDDNLTYIGLYHAPILGASTDIGYEFETGTLLSHFEGCDMVILGDIHKRQEFMLGDIKIVYPGSLIQQDYGETVSRHGFLFWDVETRTYEEVDLESSYGFYQFEVNSVEDLEDDKEIFTNK